MMRTVRRLTTTSVVGGVVAAALVAVSPTAAAAPDTTPVTQNINHGYTCQGIEWESIATFPTTPTYNDGQPVAGMINTTAGRQTTVTYPREIAPGGQFSVYVRPGTWTASGEEMGRAKFDIALPANATVRGLADVGGGSGWTSGNPQPRVERVGTKRTRSRRMSRPAVSARPMPPSPCGCDRVHGRPAALVTRPSCIRVSPWAG